MIGTGLFHLIIHGSCLFQFYVFKPLQIAGTTEKGGKGSGKEGKRSDVNVQYPTKIQNSLTSVKKKSLTTV